MLHVCATCYMFLSFKTDFLIHLFGFLDLAKLVLIFFQIAFHGLDHPFEMTGRGDHSGSHASVLPEKIQEIQDKFLFGVIAYHGIGIKTFDNLVTGLKLNLLLLVVLILIVHNYFYFYKYNISLTNRPSKNEGRFIKKYY